jgi:AcrR family transcriptional regulator
MPAAPEKRAAITRAALTVFGRDGYSRAGMDALAKEAGVSTRTVYNHFPGGKEQLFATVIHDSADAVRAATFDLMARHLDGLLDRAAADVPDALHALALDWVSPLAEFRAHFALVRQIIADAAHLPPEVLADWQATGPAPVRAELARRFAELTTRGRLAATDPQLAASHFILLTGAEVTNRTFYGVFPLPQQELEQVVRSGVSAFLRLYGR